MIRLLIAFTLFALPVAAQDRVSSHCIAVADANPALKYVHRASYGDPLDTYTVRLNYVDHSTFVIETPGGLSAATDYTGYIGVGKRVPDVVTMNNVHSSHWTARPDPGIPHVLQGWAQDGEAADHFVDLGEMLVRNVPTDVRDNYGGPGIANGNSIFVFEVAGLCIGHLGHLHHEPDDMQYAALGRLDVMLAPIDGGRTLDLPTLIKMMDRLKSSIIVPMHWRSSYSLDAFLASLPAGMPVERPLRSHFEVSLRSLPDRSTVIVLDPSDLRSTDD